MNKRVVITGMGIISPLGLSVKENWGKLMAGESGAGLITHFDASEFECKAGAEVKGFEPKKFIRDKRSLKLMLESTQYALASAEMAVSDSDLKIETLDPSRIGVYTGSGDTSLDMSIYFPALDTSIDSKGKIDYKKFGSEGMFRLHPLFLLKTLSNNAPCFISIAFNAQGSINHIVQYGVSGAQAIGEGFRAIQRGDVDVVIAAGYEYLSKVSFLTYYPLGVLSTIIDPKRACRPFDRKRDGVILGEGAGALILEELSHAIKRNATIYAELVGYGNAADAYHVIDLPEGGDGTALSIMLALKDARLETSDIEYINLHGNATIRNDKTETAAIKEVFGERAHKIPTSSTKPMTGHLLAASGPVELIICVLVMNNGAIPPTINYEYPDPDCNLYYTPNEAIESKVNVALSVTRGIGGQNTALIVRKYP